MMVVVVFSHLVRVFYSQSIFYERRKNWLYELLLLFLVVSANFTGYLLPWDQLSYWAVTIMTNMFSYIPVIGEPLAGLIRDGETVSENTLLRFYHFHTGLLPIFLISFGHSFLAGSKGGRRGPSLRWRKPNLPCIPIPVRRTGIGAAGTVLIGILVLKEPVTSLRLLFLTTLIASIIGLKSVS